MYNIYIYIYIYINMSISISIHLSAFLLVDFTEVIYLKNAAIICYVLTLLFLRKKYQEIQKIDENGK